MLLNFCRELYLTRTLTWNPERISSRCNVIYNKGDDPYPPVFFSEHPDISSLTRDDANKLRQKLGIRVLGAMACNPVASFAHMNLDGGLMKAIRKAQYEQPTPIQAQAIPLALSGRDIIGS